MSDPKPLQIPHKISLHNEISLHRLRHGLVQYCDQHVGWRSLNICSLDGLDVLKVFMTDCGREGTFLAQWPFVTSAQRYVVPGLGLRRERLILNI